MAESELFPLTEEHKMICLAARDFARKEIAPIAAEYDESGEFPYQTVEKMGLLGLHGDRGSRAVRRRWDGHDVLCFGLAGNQQGGRLPRDDYVGQQFALCHRDHPIRQ